MARLCDSQAAEAGSPLLLLELLTLQSFLRYSTTCLLLTVFVTLENKSLYRIHIMALPSNASVYCIFVFQINIQ